MLLRKLHLVNEDGNEDGYSVVKVRMVKGDSSATPQKQMIIIC